MYLKANSIDIHKTCILFLFCLSFDIFKKIKRGNYFFVGFPNFNYTYLSAVCPSLGNNSQIIRVMKIIPHHRCCFPLVLCKGHCCQTTLILNLNGC